MSQFEFVWFQSHFVLLFQQRSPQTGGLLLMRHIYNGAICVLLIALVQTIAISQCPTQAPPDCDCDYRVEEIEVCFANETYLATVNIWIQNHATRIAIPTSINVNFYPFQQHYAAIN